MYFVAKNVFAPETDGFLAIPFLSAVRRGLLLGGFRHFVPGAPELDALPQAAQARIGPAGVAAVAGSVRALLGERRTGKGIHCNLQSTHISGTAPAGDALLE
jgi:hypothetical protein